jgi:FMN phosphatase YigB (HAD superfamily)
MLARLWYGSSVRLCVFDLDHTLVRSPLDLAAMALDIRALIEQRCGPLPARPERYRVGELIAWCQANAPEVEPPVWGVALDHERRALEAATLEPGALEAVVGARRAGFATAVWTNNAREITLAALDRFALTARLDLVVTRDEMARLKPDLPFVAYRATPADLERWGVRPVARLDDLAALPAWLVTRNGGR